MTSLKDLIKDPSVAELALIAQYAALKPDAARERAFKAFANTGLPHRRMEAWKWTDLRGSVKEQAGLSAVLVPQITGADGVEMSVNQGTASDAPMSAVSAMLNGETIQLNIPAGAALSEPITISELTKGHARIALSVGEGASITLIEHHRGLTGGFANVDISIQPVSYTHLTLPTILLV